MFQFTMDFFRKLFPLMSKKKAQNTHKANDATKEIDKFHSQVDNHVNILQSYVLVDNDEGDAINSDPTESIIIDLDTNKDFHTLKNVDPIEIGPNDDTDSKDNNDAKNLESDNSVIEASNKSPEQFDVTADLLSKDADVTEASKLTNVIDDETMNSLKEFEETLNNFDKTTIVTDDFGIEYINLDEFNEIFDKLETDNEDFVSKDSLINNPLKDNVESTISSNKDNPNMNEIIDIISINSSTEDEECPSQDLFIKDTISVNSESDESSCDGYHSSDFEFISETEANMDGFIINFRRENYPNLEISENIDFSSQFLGEDQPETKKYASDPGEGTSRQNRPKNEFEDRSYRNNHHIPEGEDYLGLFQGIFSPLMPVSEIYFLENKSVRTSAMNSQYDGIGFDKQLALRRYQPDSSEDEFEDEAKECAKRILNMYPGENRKRRRRY